MLHWRIRRRQRKGGYLVFLPSALGDKRRAAIKLSSRSRRKCAGHRTQSAAHPLKQRAASRRSAQAAGVLGATPGVFTAQINQTFAFRGNLSLSRLSVEVISSGRMKIDHLSPPCASMSEQHLPGPPPPANQSAPLPWRTARVAYGRARIAVTAAPPPAFPSSLRCSHPVPSPDEGFEKVFFFKKRGKKRWKCFSGLREDAWLSRASKRKKRGLILSYLIIFPSAAWNKKTHELDASMDSWLFTT